MTEREESGAKGGNAGRAKPARQGRLFVLSWLVGFGLFLAVGLGHLDRIVASSADPATQIQPFPDTRSPTGFSRGMRAQTLDQCWDGLMWIMQAQEAAREGALRARFTKTDNAPEGREIHWSQSVSWILRVAGWLHAAVAGVPHGAGIEAAALWAMPVLFVSLVTAGGLFALRLCGEKPAALFVLALFTCGGLSSHMTFGQADHHGLAALAIIFSVFALGVALGRSGFGSEQKSAAGRLPAAVLSGVSMSVAVWISASSALPVIAAAVAGLAAGAAVFCRPGGGVDARTFSSAVRQWSAAGAAGSLFFYLLEYFPAHLGLRLEVNHPLHAVAWLGGGDLVARLAEWRGGALSPWQDLRRLAGTLAALTAVVAPVAIVAVFSEAVFVPADPFVMWVHKAHISEFQNIAAMWGKHGWIYPAGRFACPAAVLAALVLGARDRRGAALALIFGLPLVSLSALACAQVRWGVLANAFALGCFPLAAGALFSAGLAGLRRQAGFAAILALFGFFGFIQVRLAGEAFQRRASPLEPGADANRLMLVCRRIAHEIAERMPPGRRATVLSSPSVTLLLCYFGGAKGLGSYYWENAPGLKAADALFMAESEEAFRELVQRHGVTHIVLPAEEMRYLLSEGLGGAARFAGGAPPKPFLKRVVDKETTPVWLNFLTEPSPEQQKAGLPVIIEARPGQTRAEQLVEQAEMARAWARPEEASGLLHEARALDPSLARAAVCLALLEKDPVRAVSILNEAACAVEALASAVVAEARRFALPYPQEVATALETIASRLPENPGLRIEIALHRNALALRAAPGGVEAGSAIAFVGEEIVPPRSREAARAATANALAFSLKRETKKAQEAFERAFSAACDADLPVAELREIVSLMAVVRERFSAASSSER